MDLQEQLEVGHQAEDFKKYVQEHTYFEKLLTRISLNLSGQILALAPNQKDAFVELRAQIDGINLIENAVRNDIYMGQVAYEKLHGLSEEPKGLL